MVRVDFFVRDTNDRTVFYELLTFVDQKTARDTMCFLRDVLGCEIVTRVSDWKYWAVLSFSEACKVLVEKFACYRAKPTLVLFIASCFNKTVPEVQREIDYWSKLK